jgi:hypothetical protein
MTIEFECSGSGRTQLKETGVAQRECELKCECMHLEMEV